MSDKCISIAKLSVGKVAKIVGVESHTVRFWQKNFPHIKYHEGPGRRKYYDEDSVKEFQEIKRLMYVSGMKIFGIKQIVVRGRISSKKSAKLMTTHDQAKSVQHLDILNEDNRDKCHLKYGNAQHGEVMLNNSLSKANNALYSVDGKTIDSSCDSNNQIFSSSCYSEKNCSELIDHDQFYQKCLFKNMQSTICQKEYLDCNIVQQSEDLSCTNNAVNAEFREHDANDNQIDNVDRLREQFDIYEDRIAKKIYKHETEHISKYESMQNTDTISNNDAEILKNEIEITSKSINSDATKIDELSDTANLISTLIQQEFWKGVYPPMMEKFDHEDEVGIVQLQSHCDTDTIDLFCNEISQQSNHPASQCDNIFICKKCEEREKVVKTLLEYIEELDNILKVSLAKSLSSDC